MEKIQNYEVYTERMQKSMYDKLFFIDKLFDKDIKTVIDFGCADGELIVHMRQFMPEVRYIGYDIDKTMLEKAKSKAPFAEFYSRWEDIVVEPESTMVVLSSVLHEIYNYSTETEIEKFWERLLTPHFNTIVVRDMCGDVYDYPAPAVCIEKIRKSSFQKQLQDFEDEWGTIRTKNNMLHFLLKYRYTENWEREVKENYMPITYQELETHFREYNTDYEDFSSLPFICYQVKKDFDISIAHLATHVHYIFSYKRD